MSFPVEQLFDCTFIQIVSNKLLLPLNCMTLEKITLDRKNYTVTFLTCIEISLESFKMYSFYDKNKKDLLNTHQHMISQFYVFSRVV